MADLTLLRCKERENEGDELAAIGTLTDAIIVAAIVRVIRSCARMASLRSVFPTMASYCNIRALELDLALELEHIRASLQLYACISAMHAEMLTRGRVTF